MVAFVSEMLVADWGFVFIIFKLSKKSRFLIVKLKKIVLSSRITDIPSHVRTFFFRIYLFIAEHNTFPSYIFMSIEK